MRCWLTFDDDVQVAWFMQHHTCYDFDETATADIFTLCLHDALPICFPFGKNNSLRSDIFFPAGKPLQPTLLLDLTNDELSPTELELLCVLRASYPTWACFVRPDITTSPFFHSLHSPGW